MATENQQATLEGNASEVPSDNELFTVPIDNLGIARELSERDVFAGDEDFYKLLANFAKAAASKRPSPILTGLKRFSTVQKALAAGIIAIMAMVLYALLKTPPRPATGIAPIPTKLKIPITQQTSLPESPAEDVIQKIPHQIQKPQPALQQGQPLSLKVAQDFYLQKDYKKAYAAYNKLRQSLPINTQEELVRDFLQLKMAFCMEKIADSDQANHLFRMVLQSRSPVVRTIANYRLSLTEMNKSQFLKARTRAYQTIALIDALDFDRNWVLLLQRDCHLLVAESITRNVLSLCDADSDFPKGSWGGSFGRIEPFLNLSETQLRLILNSGEEQLSKGLLGPQIQKLDQRSTTARWSVICQGASIEELLARFAANANVNISWALGHDSIGLRKRPVTLYLPAATSQQFVSAAAGCAGLLAVWNAASNAATPTVNIFNPQDYSSLTEQISLLRREAILLWRRFLLKFYDDEHVPNAHFALGLLQAQQDQVTESIAEYKLVANRFAGASVAPFALLQSSKLKTNLRDYFGARQDLKQLVEQYPDVDISGQACLYLADATRKARLYGEAARLYRKAYNLGLSLESQAAAALGAGKCFYEKKDYETANKWLTRYISIVKDRTGRDLYSAYFLLGKIYLALGKPQQACDAFQYAMAGPLSKQEYGETVSAMVKGYMERQHFIGALDVLQNVHPWQFSQEELVKMLLLKSKIFRAMGLVDKAVETISNRAEYIFDSQLKAEISFELTKCYIAKGDLELARSNLAKILAIVEPGPLMHQVTLELADVCLKLGYDSQTTSICSQLLNLGPEVQTKRKALGLLAAAYNRQKNYNRAALALLGRWNGAEAINEKTTSDSSVGSYEPIPAD